MSGQAREFPAPVRLSSSPEKELKDHAVEDRSTDPEDQHGSGDHASLSDAGSVPWFGLGVMVIFISETSLVKLH